jgi:hypothetical protein
LDRSDGARNKRRKRRSALVKRQLEDGVLQSEGHWRMMRASLRIATGQEMVAV